MERVYKTLCIYFCQEQPSLWNVHSVSQRGASVKERVTHPIIMLCLEVPAQCTVEGKGHLPCTAGSLLGLAKEPVCNFLFIYLSHKSQARPHNDAFLCYKMNLPAGRLEREVWQDSLLCLHPAQFHDTTTSVRQRPCWGLPSPLLPHPDDWVW